MAGVGWSLGRPSVAEVARLADRRLDASDRLSTAFELGGPDSYLLGRQRNDADLWARPADPAAAVTSGWPRLAAAGVAPRTSRVAGPAPAATRALCPTSRSTRSTAPRRSARSTARRCPPRSRSAAPLLRRARRMTDTALNSAPEHDNAKPVDNPEHRGGPRLASLGLTLYGGLSLNLVRGRAAARRPAIGDQDGTPSRGCRLTRAYYIP